MIKNKVLISSYIVAFAFFSGCSSTPEKVAKPSCFYPGTTVPADDWICDKPIEGIPVSSVGIAEPSNAGISFMKDIATADARGKLAAQFRVQVQKMVKNFFGTTGSADSETVDRVAESTLKTITNETLVGSRAMRSAVGPLGRYYVLVALDNENIGKAAKEAVQTSMRNDAALWQQLQANKSFKELADEIAKQKVQ